MSAHDRCWRRASRWRGRPMTRPWSPPHSTISGTLPSPGATSRLSESLLQESLALRRQVGDACEIARSLNNLGSRRAWARDEFPQSAAMVRGEPGSLSPSWRQVGCRGCPPWPGCGDSPTRGTHHGPPHYFRRAWRCSRRPGTRRTPHSRISTSLTRRAIVASWTRQSPVQGRSQRLIECRRSWADHHGMAGLGGVLADARSVRDGGAAAWRRCRLV